MQISLFSFDIYRFFQGRSDSPGKRRQPWTIDPAVSQLS